jgi:hypothetical protein
LDFKGTPSEEEHKAIFYGLKICKMALSNQTDFPAFFRLTGISSIPEYDNPLLPMPPKMAVCRHVLEN